jgi:hypothetical protein
MKKKDDQKNDEKIYDKNELKFSSKIKPASNENKTTKQSDDENVVRFEKNVDLYDFNSLYKRCLMK